MSIGQDKKTSLELKNARIWSRAHELKIIADSTAATCKSTYMKQIKIGGGKMFYGMIKEFGQETVGMWCMFSAMSVVGSVVIIACNIAGKF